MAIATVKSISPGIVIDPCVLESSRRFLGVAAEINPPVFIVTSNSLGCSSRSSAERCTDSASAAATTTAAATASTLKALERADIHRLFDHVGDIFLLLERSSLTVREQRAAIRRRHRVHDLHCRVRANRVTERGKSDRTIGRTSLEQARETDHHSKSHRHHGSTNPDGLAVP
jgi:hypothetical protein